MIYDVTNNLAEVNFYPNTEVEEILQNVKMIITTPKGSVPLDRDFGISAGLIDLPIAAAQAKMTAEITAAVKKFEPRALVTEVLYSGKEIDGILEVKVRIKLNERNLRNKKPL